LVTSLPLKINNFVITSPSIAPLQCPTCNGPVGLAETNSTLYLFFLKEFDPYFSFRFNKSFKNFCQKSSLNSIFKKPGSAINIFLNSGNFLIRLGILERAEIISKNLTFSKKADIYFRLKRLIDKNEMGELFKVMLITNKKTNFNLGF